MNSIMYFGITFYRILFQFIIRICWSNFSHLIQIKVVVLITFSYKNILYFPSSSICKIYCPRLEPVVPYKMQLSHCNLLLIFFFKKTSYIFTLNILYTHSQIYYIPSRLINEKILSSSFLETDRI